MSVSDKHMEAAEHTLDLVLCNGPEVPDYRAEAIKVIAAALAKAEREGMKRAAEIVSAYPPEGFFEALAAVTYGDARGFRVFEGDSGNWAWLMSKLLKPYADAILSQASEP